MTPARAKSTWEKYETFLNSFHPEVQQCIQRLELIRDKISRHEMFFRSSIFKSENAVKIYIYIYIYTCVCECVYPPHTHTHLIYIYIYIYILPGTLWRMRVSDSGTVLKSWRKLRAATLSELLSLSYNLVDICFFIFGNIFFIFRWDIVFSFYANY